MKQLRAYKNFYQQSQFLMAAYLRVMNHINTSVHGDKNELKEVKRLSTKCYTKQLKTSRRIIAELKQAWDTKNVDETSRLCKELSSSNRQAARLGKLFESPIVGGRKGPDYYTRLEEEAEARGDNDWEFKPKDYPPVVPENLSHSVCEFKESLELFLGVGDQGSLWT